MQDVKFYKEFSSKKFIMQNFPQECSDRGVTHSFLIILKLILTILLEETPESMFEAFLIENWEDWSGFHFSSSLTLILGLGIDSKSGMKASEIIFENLA